MVTKRQQSDPLEQFIRQFRDELVAWANETQMKQAALAATLGVDPSAVSHALRPGGHISENLIRKISATVPQFRDAYSRFYALKYGTSLPADAGEIAERQRRRAELIEQLKAAKKEVTAALDAFTEAAIEAVKRA